MRAWTPTRSELPAPPTAARIVGCLTRDEKVRSRRFGSTVTGDIDLNGILGLQPVRNGYEQVGVTFVVKGEALEDVLRRYRRAVPAAVGGLRRHHERRARRHRGRGGLTQASRGSRSACRSGPGPGGPWHAGTRAHPRAGCHAPSYIGRCHRIRARPGRRHGGHPRDRHRRPAGADRRARGPRVHVPSRDPTVRDGAIVNGPDQPGRRPAPRLGRRAGRRPLPAASPRRRRAVRVRRGGPVREAGLLPDGRAAVARPPHRRRRGVAVRGDPVPTATSPAGRTALRAARRAVLRPAARSASTTRCWPGAASSTRTTRGAARTRSSSPSRARTRAAPASASRWAPGPGPRPAAARRSTSRLTELLDGGAPLRRRGRQRAGGRACSTTIGAAPAAAGGRGGRGPGHRAGRRPDGAPARHRRASRRSSTPAWTARGGTTWPRAAWPARTARMVCPTCFCTTVEDVSDLTGHGRATATASGTPASTPTSPTSTAAPSASRRGRATGSG